MKNFYFFLGLMCLFTACSPKMSLDWTKDTYTDRSYKKIAVVGISKDVSARTQFESKAVDLLKEKGINAVEGISVFPQNMSEEERSPKDLIKLIEENQLDGVITMALIDENEETRYVQGNTERFRVGYARFGKYYVARYATVIEPGYYENTKSFVIEAVLYDLKGDLNAKEDRLVWTGQSTVVNPSSTKSAAKSFTKRMVNHLTVNEIIKAK